MSDVLAFADLLKQNETLLGTLYQECARLFPAERAEFELLAGEEEGHAIVFNNLMAAISTAPENWHLGKVSAQAITAIQNRIRQVIEDIRARRADPKYAVTSAMSIEQSLGEQSLGKAFITEDTDSLIRLAHVMDAFPSHFGRLRAIHDRLFPNANRLGFSS